MATTLQSRTHPKTPAPQRCIQSEQTLVQLCSGDPIAWQRIDERTRPILMAFLLRRGVHHANAEEITQVALSSLAKAMTSGQFRSGSGAVAGYLFTIARREIAKAVAEKQSERPDYARGLGGDFWDSDLSECDDRVLWENTWARGTYSYCLDRIRAASPDLEFEAFELRIRRGMPVRVIAECLGIDVLETSRCIHRTKQRLLALVAELNHDEQWLHEGCLPAEKPA